MHVLKRNCQYMDAPARHGDHGSDDYSLASFVYLQFSSLISMFHMCYHLRASGMDPVHVREEGIAFQGRKIYCLALYIILEGLHTCHMLIDDFIPVTVKSPACAGVLLRLQLTIEGVAQAVPASQHMWL